MGYRLSLLDKSPLPTDGGAGAALAQTVALARRADELGYHRFWVAEHHGSPRVASAAPEVLIAYLLARTSRIRVGSGGVMLQHYAPYKVAEVFSVLANLAPGRVDLGIGKAPGGLPSSTKALRNGRPSQTQAVFADQVADLEGFLGGALAPDHPLAEAVLTPVAPTPPERVLLGASTDSARLAAGLGWAFCFAAHLDGDQAQIERALGLYAAKGGRRPLLAVPVLAANTKEAAARQAGELRIFKIHFPDGQSFNLQSRETAIEFARQAGATAYRLEEKRPNVIAGTSDHVHRELDTLQQRFGVDEFVIDMPTTAFAERLASIELLAGVEQSAAA